ncbi:MAG: hypothetical protein RJB26_2616 [Pseudomonadota bacterium]|jgi:uncharacterized protein (TIGR02001 family)
MSVSTRKYALAAAVSLALLGVAGQAAASELTATVTAANEYDFRGISQSGKDPALQMSLDFATDSGFAAGVWASNIDYGPDASEDREVDFILGYSKEILPDLSLDVGGVYYTYYGDGSFDYPEYYVGGTWKGLSGKLWYTDNYSNSGLNGWYVEVNYEHELPKGFTLGLHGGHSRGGYWGGNLYKDYSVGVSRSFGPIEASVKYAIVDNKSGFTVRDNVFNNESRVLFQISTTFPWSKD